VRRLSSGRRRTAAIIMGTGLVASVMTLTAAASPADALESTVDTASDTLGAHDLKLLAEAEAKGVPTVTLIVATKAGQAPTAAEELRKLGGRLAKRVDQVGYIRAQVPTSAVKSAARAGGVSAIDLDETIKLPDPRPESGSGSGSGGSAVSAGPGPGTPTTSGSTQTKTSTSPTSR
jgi:hypothetical protein